MPFMRLLKTSFALLLGLLLLLRPALASSTSFGDSADLVDADAAQGPSLRNEQMLLAGEKHWLAAEVPTPEWTSHAMEFRRVREDIVFGFVSDASAFDVRIGLLRLWWLPGSSGCVYFDETMVSSAMKALLPRGLDICYTPATL